MFVIPLPICRDETGFLAYRRSEFDLCINDERHPHYLIIQGNAVTWIGQGSVPGMAAYQIVSRETVMNGKLGLPVNRGNMGFLGKFSGLDDAVRKLFPKEGYCVSGMRFSAYTGQRLTAKKEHFMLIEPIVAMLDSDDPAGELRKFFSSMGWGSNTPFECSGLWSNGMRLWIGREPMSSLEAWYVALCSKTLK